MDKHLQTLEFPKILERLADAAALGPTKAVARALRPARGFAACESLLQQTMDAHSLTARFGTPSFGQARDVSDAITRAQAGGMLSMRELLDVAEVLRVVRSLQAWRSDAGVQTPTSLDEWFSVLTPNAFLENKITGAVLSEDEIADRASPALADIRRKIRAASNQIRDRLEKLLRSGASFLQDAIITQRDGRYVIPVKAAHKAEVPGLVHDMSASGATLFIEPMAVVEINNQLKLLLAQERQEIDRILAELSAQVAGFAPSIETSYASMLELDLVFAKARLAYEMQATAPKLNEQGRVVLMSARHPLLDAKTVVPVSLTLGDSFDTLVVTGPNTGGKTVTLKTIGLLSVMAMSGLMIPADAGSELAVFREVLADIGDEQSIEQSLSTFSAHMRNIVSILERAGEGSLVLLDELGAGTDPIEGAALAMAILTRLRAQGARTAATTHYAELKAYALQTPGVENACCEFDVKTLRPTYRLLIGVPGRSNAFAISEKLGLDKAVIEQARASLSADRMRFEAVADALERARQTAETQQRQAADLRSAAAQTQRQATETLERLRRESDSVEKRARQQASLIVEQARRQANEMLAQLETFKKQADKGKPGEALREARRAADHALASLEELARGQDSGEETAEAPSRPLRVGDRVTIVDLGAKGCIEQLHAQKGEATLRVGGAQLRLSVSRLRLSGGGQAQEPSKAVGARAAHVPRIKRDAKHELDLRGLSRDEALLELDRYLDDALLAGLPGATIIHGKGTGALRDAVHGALRAHKGVKSFRLGAFGEGETGVTIVSFE